MIPATPIINGALLLLCTALIIILLYVPPTNKKLAPALTHIAPETIHTIQIKRPNEADIKLGKKDHRWFITQPLSIMAHPDRVNRILHLLKARSHHQQASKAMKLAKIGLDPARITLALNEHVFYFGDSEAIDGLRYVRFGEQIHLLKDDFYHPLLTTAYFLVDLHPVPQGQAIREIRFSTAYDPYTHAEHLAWQQASALSVSKAEPPEQTDQWVEISLGPLPQTIRFIILHNAHGFALIRTDMALQYQLDWPDKKALLPPPLWSSPGKAD